MAKSEQGKVGTLNQICKLIPKNLVSKLAYKHGVQSRKFSPWSHVVALLYAQLSHALSLNDVCDAMDNHSGKLVTIRGATPPKRNTLSNANRTRNPEMAKELFWKTLDHLQAVHPKFGVERKYVKMPKKFKRTISAVDSSTIKLVANCMSWAKHRRRKAAAKLHMCLDLGTFLPRFAIVEKAKHHDATKAYEVCAGLQDGEIVVFDRAYVDYPHLHKLDERGVFWVVRKKKTMSYKVIKEFKVKKGGKIIRDQLVILKDPKSYDKYPKQIRMVTGMVEVKGKEKEMTFLSNNLEWAPLSICQLYESRWAIEVFFKEIKQTLKLSDFLGHNEEAVHWQIWTAMLAYLLLRFCAFSSGWSGTFTRLVTVLRAVLWHNFDLFRLLRSYGTANDPPRIRATPEQAYLPLFEPESYGTA